MLNIYLRRGWSWPLLLQSSESSSKRWQNIQFMVFKPSGMANSRCHKSNGPTGHIQYQVSKTIWKSWRQIHQHQHPSTAISSNCRYDFWHWSSGFQPRLYLLGDLHLVICWLQEGYEAINQSSPKLSTKTNVSSILNAWSAVGPSGRQSAIQACTQAKTIPPGELFDDWWPHLPLWQWCWKLNDF